MTETRFNPEIPDLETALLTLYYDNLKENGIKSEEKKFLFKGDMWVRKGSMKKTKKRCAIIW